MLVLGRKEERGGGAVPLFLPYGRQDLNLHTGVLDPKSNASANSATPANCVFYRFSLPSLMHARQLSEFLPKEMSSR